MNTTNKVNSVKSGNFSDPFSTRKARWNRLLEQRGKPGFCFVVDYRDPNLNLLPEPKSWPSLKAERIEWKVKEYERRLEQAKWLDDDRVPWINMITGTEIFAEALGCPVHRPVDNNPFALPAIHSAGEVASIQVPDIGQCSLTYLFEMADELRRRLGPEAVFRMVDIQSPMDIAALIWEKASFFMGMIESPEAVMELADKVRQLLTAFLDEWFRRYGTNYVAHYPDYFMSGGMTLSEDEAGSVNDEMFEEFFMPHLNALSRRFGGIGIHCCADAGHQWKHFRNVEGLRLINFVNPFIRKPLDYVVPAYDFFRQTCAQWHLGWTPSEPAETWFSQYPMGCRPVLNFYSENKDEAVRICSSVQEARNQLAI